MITKQRPTREVVKGDAESGPVTRRYQEKSVSITGGRSPIFTESIMNKKGLRFGLNAESLRYIGKASLKLASQTFSAIKYAPLVIALGTSQAFASESTTVTTGLGSDAAFSSCCAAILISTMNMANAREGRHPIFTLIDIGVFAVGSFGLLTTAYPTLLTFFQ